MVIKAIGDEHFTRITRQGERPFNEYEIIFDMLGRHLSAFSDSLPAKAEVIKAIRAWFAMTAGREPDLRTILKALVEGGHIR